MIKKYLTLVSFFLLLIGSSVNVSFAQCQQVKIQANDTKGCAPHIINLKAQNLPKSAKAHWVIGTDTFQDRQTLSRAYRNKQHKDVTLLVKKQGKVICSKKKPGLIQIDSRPSNLKLKTDKQRICGGPTKVSFSLSSSVKAKKVDWIIDNERLANKGKSLTYQFQSSGAKTISIRVTNAAGCTTAKTFEDFIKIFSKPSVKLNLSKSTGTAPFKTTSSFTTKDTLISYQWQFPKASKINGANSKSAIADFRKAGQYTSFLTYVDNHGCQYTDTLDSSINVVKPVQLDFNVKDSILCPGETTQLAVDKPVKNGRYEWEISNGSKTYKEKGERVSVSPAKSGLYDVSLFHVKNGVKQSNTAKKAINVEDFQADFTATPACNCSVPVNVVLNNQISGGQARSYHWDVIDGNSQSVFSSNQNNAAFRATQKGEFDVRLTSESTNGCKDTTYKKDYLQLGELTTELDLDFKTYAVDQPIHLDFPDDSFCTNDSLYVSWLIWNDQKTKLLKQSRSRNPRFTFKDSGNYKVSLKVSTKHGCQQSVSTGSKDNPLKVSKPDPDFSLSRTQDTQKADPDTNHYCRNEAFKLYQHTVPTALNYTHHWKIQHQQNPNIIIKGQGDSFKTQLAKPGIYDVIYTAKVDSVTGFKKVRKGYLVINGSEINWSVNTQDHCVPYKGKVSAKLDTHWTHPNPASGKRQTQWYRLDTSNFELKKQKTFTANASIDKYGTYGVGIEITGPTGCTDRFKSESLLDVGVNADFQMPDNICFGNITKLHNDSYTNGTPSKFIWQLPDADEALQSSKHDKIQKVAFPDSGHFEIKLTVADSNGCKDTKAQKTYVERVFTNFSSPDTLQHCAQAMVDFTAQSSSNVDRYQWDFGDGHKKKTTKKALTKVYKENSGDSTSGFDVQMTAISENGCRETVKKEKYVTVVGPVIDFTIDKKEGCEPLKVDFDITGKNYQQAFASYGDKSNIDTAPGLEHVYKVRESSRKQNFKPFVLAKDQTGCYAVSEMDQPLTVYEKPDASFSLDTTQGCHPVKVTFRNQAEIAEKTHWNFSDTSATFSRKSFQDTISHNFGQGRHNVKMIAETADGCFDTVHHVDTIKGYSYPSVDFQLSRKGICPKTSFDLKSKVNGKGLALKEYQWKLERPNGTDTIKKQNLQGLIYNKISTYDVELAVTNEKGCRNSLEKEDFIDIMDTVSNAPNLQFVTHQQATKAGAKEKLNIHWEANEQKAFDQYQVLAQQKDQNDVRAIATIDERDQTKLTYKPNGSSGGYRLMVQGQCGRSSDTSELHSPAKIQVASPKLFTNRLSWTGYKGWSQVKGYEIHAAREGENFKAIDTVPGNQTVYSNEDLCRGDYHYQVVALHPGKAFKSWSNPAVKSPKYKRPEYKRPMLSTTVLNGNLNTTWNHPVNWEPRSYAIQRKSKDDANWQKVAEGIKDNDWVDSSVAVNDASYQYRISALNHCDEPSPEAGLSSSILLNAKSRQEGIKLVWESDAQWQNHVASYEIQLKQGKKQDFRTIQTVSGDQTAYSDKVTREVSDTALIYRIKAHQSTGNISVSNETSAIQKAKVYVPNAFTPNNDGLNDEFKVEGKALKNLDGEGFAQFELAIFNRWGERVFKTNDPTQGWDGTDASGKELSQGTFIFKLNAVSKNGESFAKKGKLTLIR